MHRSNSSSTRYQKLDVPSLALRTSKSDSKMHRAFSLRRHRSHSNVSITKQPTIEEDVPPVPSIDRSGSKFLRRRHSRAGSYPQTGTVKPSNLEVPSKDDGFPKRSVSRREKLAKVIANPDTIFDRDPAMPPPESRFNPNPKNVILRTFFSPNVDFAPTVPTVYVSTHPRAPPTPPSPAIPEDPSAPLFKPELIPNHIIEDLPAGYAMRPLCRADHARGFLEVLRISGKVGYVNARRWDERCDWLKAKGQKGEEYVLVIVDIEKEKIVAVGRWVGQKGFMNNLATNGCIEEIAVARDQKGKKMGLRVLEALVHISKEHGCVKTTATCTEANEAFHAQCNFAKEGSLMVLHHGLAGKRGELLT